MADHYALKCEIYRVIHPHKCNVLSKTAVELQTHVFLTAEAAKNCAETGSVSGEQPRMAQKVIVNKIHNDDFEPELYIDSVCEKLAGEKCEL